jgi:hypothetical protein
MEARKAAAAQSCGYQSRLQQYFNNHYISTTSDKTDLKQG